MINKKKLTVIGVCTFILIIAAGFLLCRTGLKVMASANEAETQNVYYDYRYLTGTNTTNCRYLTGTNSTNCVTLADNDNGVQSSKPIQCDNSDSREISIQLVGKDYYSSADGAIRKTYIGTDMVNVKIAGGFQSHTLIIQNNRGSIIEKTNTISISATVPDGQYTLIYTGYSEWEDAAEGMKAAKLICTFKFTVDTIKPEAQVIKSDSSNTAAVTWNNAAYFATLNGESYLNGQTVSKEGKHTVMVFKPYGPVLVLDFEIGHRYEAVSNKESTCSEQGYTLYKCKSCDNTFKDNFKPLVSHKYSLIETVSPTCTSDGSMNYSCSDCSETYQETIKATGHKYKAVTILPTCTENGRIQYNCTDCSYAYEKTDGTYPLGHNYVSAIKKAATCVEEGQRHYVCETCSESYDSVIPSTGHNYAISDTESKNGITIRTYACMQCAFSYAEEIAGNYEEVSNYVEYLFKQYSPYMFWVFLVTAGVWSIVLVVMIIIARKNEDKEKAKKMVVNYIIGLIVIFGIVIACPYLVRGISILVT